MREIDWPNAGYFICHCFDYFTELKGDRTYKDDQAVIGGIGRINEQFFTIVGIHRKKYKGKCILQFWNASSRRVQKIITFD